MYWFQLHDKIGPIVINVSRCVVDIFTISLTYVLFCMAFTFGIVYVLNIDHKDVIEDDKTKNESEIMDATAVKDFVSTFHVILWTIFEAGQKVKQFPHKTVEQKFATFLYFIYQVFIIIILLNLLIAIMNATVQRLQDKRQLYWKFVRTSIWVEYFDENSMLPVPFSLLHIPWAIFKGTYELRSLIETQYRRQCLGMGATTNFWQARPPHWRPHQRLAIPAVYSAKSRQGLGLGGLAGLGSPAWWYKGSV
jgi:hypothetical protein